MGRNRKYFSIEERKIANRMYQAKFKDAHKVDMKEIYNITALRSYYRRKLKTATDPDEIAKIEYKIADLTSKLLNIKHQLNE